MVCGSLVYYTNEPLVVDAWLVYKGVHGMLLETTQAEFYSTLAEQLIDNCFDHVGRRDRQVLPSESATYNNGAPTSGVGAHLTPTRRRKRRRNGEVTSATRQNKCRVCRVALSTKICSLCKEEDPDGREVHICDTRGGRLCFATHMSAVHGL